MSGSKARDAARLAFALKEVSATHVSFEAKIDAAIDAYIAARREEGFVEVPREPTEAMEQAMLDALERRGDYCNAKTAAEACRAMLNAAEQQRTEQT